MKAIWGWWWFNSILISRSWSSSVHNWLIFLSFSLPSSSFCSTNATQMLVRCLDNTFTFLVLISKVGLLAVSDFPHRFSILNDFLQHKGKNSYFYQSAGSKLQTNGIKEDTYHLVTLFGTAMTSFPYQISESHSWWVSHWPLRQPVDIRSPAVARVS